MDEELKFPEDYLHFDSMDILSQYFHLTSDIRKAYESGDNFDIPKMNPEIDHIFCIGMGGSAISFDLLNSYLTYLGINKPITIVRDYAIPNTITKNSLILLNSYSGNTEETLFCYKAVHRITDNIFSISSGGKLEELCRLNKTPFILVPSGYQPRTAAISFLFFPFLKLLERLGIIENQSKSLVQITSTLAKSNLKDLAISISEKLFEKTPLIYSSELMYPVAYRMKTAVNENAKTQAFCHRYSELNHNELIGFTNVRGNYHIVTFRFNHDHRRIQKRMDLTKEITNSKGIATTEIALTGDDFLTKMFSAVVIGDLTTIFLALRYKIDPSPVDMVEEFKKKLGTVII
ncbi:MAG: bifunctional phosphoglucose/phosphomannose isomerase [Candidatus Woesearchaeota archaeon]